jgi:hypothetical protein
LTATFDDQERQNESREQESEKRGINKKETTVDIPRGEYGSDNEKWPEHPAQDDTNRQAGARHPGCRRGTRYEVPQE